MVFNGRSDSGPWTKRVRIDRSRTQAAVDGTKGDGTDLVSIVNAQLDRCAAEIARRSTTQQTIQAGAISAAAGLGAAVIGGFTPLVLLLLPIISVSLGSQWLDHHRTIGRIGTYAAEELEPALHRRMASVPAAPQLWEGYWRQRQTRRTSKHIWAIPVLTIFYGLPILALAIAIPSALLHPAEAAPENLPTFSIGTWPRVLWGFGVLLTVHGLYTAWRTLFPRTGA
ncbi:hypothetical protein GCM10009584_18380 [Ornithinimicrobium humiphilum]|uniref:Uncharacterized protein n=1 Tax=Ornithinimicrobium humiphilum TaxID=125288 RepID=A0A543KLI1_9MICO|nr:hypothetical protein [Ornithinimicrobium humiphilum]TQM95927.1 hypothetical protein FB476_0778 [Ornithinimicrobium humiphilum]